MTQKEIKQQYKPWVTNEILKSIKIREKLYKKYIKAKDKDIKEEYHKILSDCRQSKKIYFQKFFSENDNMRNTWKGIKGIININSKSKSQPNSLLVKNVLVSEPKIVAETFNN